MASLPSPILGLSGIIADAHYSVHGKLFRPDYKNIRIELNQLLSRDDLLPRSYQISVLKPFLGFLESLQYQGFYDLFNSNEDQLSPVQKTHKKIIEEIAEALLQLNHGEKDGPFFRDLKALQAVISTIYAETLNSKVSGLARQALPPLAKWGHTKGPYTFYQTKTAEVGVNAGVVSLPLSNRTNGLAAWSSLGHEVAGHNFLDAIPGLVAEFQETIRVAITAKCDPVLAEYWCACAEETASDVLGALTMGPSFGIGLIGYLRGVRKGSLVKTGPYYSMNPKNAKNSLLLSCGEPAISQILVESLNGDIALPQNTGFFGFLGPANTNPMMYSKFNSKDRHPLDILRPFVIARTIALFQPSSRWIEIIEKEALKDFGTEKQITLLELNTEFSPKGVKVKYSYAFDKAIVAAQSAAEIIATTPMKCLNQTSLMNIIRWKIPEDEDLVYSIKQAFVRKDKNLPASLKTGQFYAKHVIAASLLFSIEENANTEETFARMKDFLFQAYKLIPHGFFDQYVTTKPNKGSEEHKSFAQSSKK